LQACLREYLSKNKLNSKVLLTHPGTQHARHLAKQLYKNNALNAFHTGIAFGENSWQKKLTELLPASVKNKLSNRIVYGVPANVIKQYPLLEIKALRAIKKGRDAQHVFFERNKAFQNNIPDSAILNADVVIGFDTSSWILAQRCLKLNRRFILDISTPHPYEKQPIADRVFDQYPDWAFSIEQESKSQEMIDLELMEMDLAHQIVVASTFSKNSLIKQGIPEAKIHVNPYGTDVTLFKPAEKKQNETVKFVYVGLVHARKGVPVLLEAWNRLKPANSTLTLIGPISTQIEQLIKATAPDVNIMGRVPYDALPALLADQDVLVFPSYFEGFALVIPEAMASGLTVISTPATCAPDIIDNNGSGFIIPCGDADMLAKQMSVLIDDRDILRAMQTKALTSIQNFTWDAYGERWGQIIQKPLT
jgi:starch synthase